MLKPLFLALSLISVSSFAAETAAVIPSDHPLSILSNVVKVTSVGTQKVNAEEYGPVSFNVRAATILEGGAMNSYAQFITFSAGELNAATYGLLTRFSAIPTVKAVAGRPATYQVSGYTYDHELEKTMKVCFELTGKITDPYHLPGSLSVAPCRK